MFDFRSLVVEALESSFKTAYVWCTDSETGADADVISQSDKRIVVVFKDTVVRLELSRKDTKKPYVGRSGNKEYTLLDADIE
jgi:hypothetical protein